MPSMSCKPASAPRLREATLEFVAAVEPCEAALPTGGSAVHQRFDRVEVFRAYAEARGHTLLELAVSALASTSGMGSIIAGATRPEQVRANVAAGSWEPSSADVEELRALR